MALKMMLLSNTLLQMPSIQLMLPLFLLRLMQLNLMSTTTNLTIYSICLQIPPIPLVLQSIRAICLYHNPPKFSLLIQHRNCQRYQVHRLQIAVARCLITSIFQYQRDDIRLLLELISKGPIRDYNARNALGGHQIQDKTAL